MARPIEYENSKPKQRASYIEDEKYYLYCKIQSEKGLSYNKSIQIHIDNVIDEYKKNY